MYHHGTKIFEPKREELADPIDTDHPAGLPVGKDLDITTTHHASTIDSHRLDHQTVNGPLKLAPNGLDLRKLRH
jgi:hypothetical protein